MELSPFLITFVSSILAITITTGFLFLNKSSHRHRHYPPSPPSLPVIGHLHLLSLPLHQLLARLSHRYGPSLLFLRFGSRPVLIVSSPSAVEECFTKHDVTFANRPRLPHGKHISYDYTALAAASYGPLLCNLRRVAIAEIFSPLRIRSMGAVRWEEVRLMTKVLFAESCRQSRSDAFRKADMKVVFSELLFNVIMKIIAGKRYFGVNADSEPEEGTRFRELIEELFAVVDAASPQDFLPFLRWFGFSKAEKRLVRLRGEMDAVFQELIDERRRKGPPEKKGEDRTIIDVFLSLQEKTVEDYSDDVIKGTILTLIAAGTHTSTAALEWGLSLLLNNPQSLQKLKDEIDHQVGHERLINHLDLPNLTYLNNVVKETLRLFPTVPLLLPHESSEECKVQGYDIPKKTIMFANIYSIHRDPGLWDEPTKFEPGRFDGSGPNGNKYMYFPFGLGRRSCLGEGLGMQIVSLGLGALIQCFEWERAGEDLVDMTEGAGVAMPKKNPLVAMYRPRNALLDVLSKL